MSELRKTTEQKSVSVSSPSAATKQEAARIAARLIGSYPNIKLDDSQTYIAELTALLTQYPPGVGYPACETARRKSPDYIPSVGAVHAEAEALWGHRREALTWSQTWDQRAQRQLEERRAIDDRKAGTTEEQRREHVRERLGYVPGERQHDTRPPSCRGNVLVPPGVPQYAAVLARTQEPGTDPKDWGHATDGRGLWVPLDWIKTRPASGLQTLGRAAAPAAQG